MISKIIGGIIIVTFLGFCFAMTVFDTGVVSALQSWGFALLLTALVVIGAYLLIG
ncbi:hypothetical protein SAMN04515624_1803 [Eubacterium maltosivorans]|uniref:hypothetical protein n=1 Tax=Eubacterium maltosivorans TaxID=2041044 RepID=UPI00088DF1B3|nr:hypothetical protein [Eubacterium maltosivorans]WPK78854.1 hypothetical protein EUMA32_02500 [Eubacterium maltosivorans]SDP90875.1 hypothetical protein SAMN04515624_1803 [Eubacterium maltosivorans]